MTTGHSIFIIVLTVANIAGCLWLLWWTRRSPRRAARPPTDTTGHVWDEDLRELNNPAAALVAVAVHHHRGLRRRLSRAVSGPGQLHGHARTGPRAPNTRRESRLNARAHREDAGAVQRSRGAPNSRATRRRSTSAATCSSTTAPPAMAPMAAARRASPTSPTRTGCGAAMPTPWSQPSPNGRTGVMPPWGEVLGRARRRGHAASTCSACSGRKLEAGDPRAGGAEVRASCASACHGADARGNPMLGAPNLTDGVWLHGGSLAAVRDSIEKGRMGACRRMPRASARPRVKLLAAYVLSLGGRSAGRRQRGQRR